MSRFLIDRLDVHESMEALIKGWERFCKGEMAFDKSHFLTLLHGDALDRSALESVLQYFPFKEKLLANCERFFKARQQRYGKSILLSEEEACAIAMKDLAEKSKALEAFEERELLEIVKQVKPVVIDSVEDFELAAYAEWPNCEMQIIVGDYCDDKIQNRDQKTDALFEAFFGADNSYDIQWFLGSPLIDASLSFEYYLLLWEAGYDVALTEQKLLIVSECY